MYFLITTLFVVSHFFINVCSSNEIREAEVRVIGAPLSSSSIEGVLGASNVPRAQFYSYSSDPVPGFLGPQHLARAPLIREQPGVFPALKLGSDSLTFSFSYEGNNLPLTPVVIKPDGTIYKGFAMSLSSATQTIEIPYPAQIGLYTLFLLDPSGSDNEASLHVTAATSSQPHRVKQLLLKPLSLNKEQTKKTSSELIYRGYNSSLNFFE